MTATRPAATGSCTSLTLRQMVFAGQTPGSPPLLLLLLPLPVLELPLVDELAVPSSPLQAMMAEVSRKAPKTNAFFLSPRVMRRGYHERKGKSSFPHWNNPLPRSTILTSCHSTI